jgi:hypothetical protein
MAKLSNYRRILSTDYEDQYKSLVDRLATSLNNSFDEVYSALNNNLTFSENMLSTVATLTVTVDSTGAPLRTSQFKVNSNQSNVTGIIVIYAAGTDTAATPPSGGVFVSYTKNDTLVTISNIKGLVANIPYSIKLIALG